MKKFAHFIILASLLLTSITAFAEEPEKLELIISTGVGIDTDGAKTNAIRNAIEQVVGTFVSSETIVKNSELISDNILSYSGGYVKELKVISQGKSPDGLYTVKIETLVVVTKLKMKLKELNIGLRKVEGGSLFAESVSRIQEQKSGSTLFLEVLSKYPQAAYSFDVGKLEIVSTDPENNKSKILIPVTIRFDQQFVQKLKEVLRQVSSEELENVEIFAFRRDSIIAKKEKAAICFARRMPLKSGLLDKCWSFNKALLRNDAQGNFLGDRVLEGYYKINFSLKNTQGRIIDRVKYVFKSDESDSAQKQGIQFNNDFESYRNANELKANFNPPNMQATLENTFGLILTDGGYRLNKTIEIDNEQLKEISSVEVSFDPIKLGK